MIRHKWDKETNTCTKCGLKRKRKYWKLLMAIVNHPPYNAYKTGTNWYYWRDNGPYPIEGTFKRPDCNVITLKQVVKEYLKQKEQTIDVRSII